MFLNRDAIADLDVKIEDVEYITFNDGRVKFIVWRIRNGKKHFWHGVAPIRITRVPRLQTPTAQLAMDPSQRMEKDRQFFLQEMDQVNAALWERKIPISLKIALRNTEEGEIVYWIYYAIARSKSKAELLKRLEQRLIYMVRVFEGRFRQIKYTFLTVDEATDLFSLENCRYVSVLTGIPSRAGTSDMPREQLEVIRSAIGMEGDINVILYPVSREEILEALDVITKEYMTPVQSNMMGTDGFSFFISLPMTIAVNSSEHSAESLSRSSMHSIQEAKALQRVLSRQSSVKETHSVSHTETHGNVDSISHLESIADTELVSKTRSLAESKSHSVMHSQQYSLTKQLSETITEQYSRGVTRTEMVSEVMGRSVSRGKVFSESIADVHSFTRGESEAKAHSLLETSGETYGKTLSEQFGLTESRAFSMQQGLSRGHVVGRNEVFGETFMQGRAIANEYALARGYGTQVGYGEQFMRSEVMGTQLTRGYARTTGFSRGYAFGQSMQYMTGLSKSMQHGVSYYDHLAQMTTGRNTYYSEQILKDYNMRAVMDQEAFRFGGAIGEALAVSRYLDRYTNLPGWVKGLVLTLLAGKTGLSFLPGGRAIGGALDDIFNATYSRSGAETYYEMIDPSKGYFQKTVSHGYTDIQTHSMYYDPYGGRPRVENESFGITRTESIAKGYNFTRSMNISQSMSIQDAFSRIHQSGFSFGRSRNYAFSNNVQFSSGYSYQRSISQALSRQRGLILQDSLVQSELLGLTRSQARSHIQGVSLLEQKQRSLSIGVSETKTLTSTETIGRTVTRGVSEMYSEMNMHQWGYSKGIAESEIYSKGYAKTKSTAETIGETTAETRGETITKGYQLGETRGYTKTKGLQRGHSRVKSQSIGYIDAVAIGSALGESVGNTFTVGSTTGKSSIFSRVLGRSFSQMMSGGLVPTFGVTHTRQWKKEELNRLIIYLDAYRRRMEKAKLEGAWYYTAIITSKRQSWMYALASTLESALMGPLSEPEGIELHVVEDPKLKQLLAKYSVLGILPKIKRRDKWDGFGVDKYKYATLINTYEATTITHLPRTELPGIKQAAEDVPIVFNMNPPEDYIKSGDYKISLGWIVNIHKDEATGIELKIPVSRLSHTLIVGKTQYGKTNLSIKLVAELANNGYDVIVLDWKHTWRKLVSLIDDQDRVLVFTLAKDVAPLTANPLRPPATVPPEIWAELIADLFAYAYAPFPRSRSIVLEELTQLYRQFGVFDNHGDPNFTNYPTMVDLLGAIQERQMRRSEVSLYGRGEIESINAILSRLWQYGNQNYPLHEYFGSEPIGIPVENLYTSGRVIILEAAGLFSAHRQFILSWLAAGAYLHQQGLARPRERPLIIVFEEAHNIIPNEEKLEALANVKIQESIFETMVREALEYRILLFFIGQNPGDLPNKILTNTDLKITFRLEESKDQEAELIVKQLGFDPRWDHRHIARFLARLPRGRAIAKVPFTTKQEDAWPYYIETQYIGQIEYPSDEEIRNLMENRIQQLFSDNNQEN